MNISYLLSNFILCQVILVTTNMGYSQMVGPDCYLKGNVVEVGVDGAWGYEGVNTVTSPPLPGMHFRSNTDWFGFVANPQMDGWLTFDGDFFTPGTPENGWGFEAITGGASTKAGNNCANVFGGVNEIPGSLGSSWHMIGSCILADWNGAYATSGLDLDFHVNYYLNMGDLFYTTTVTITNNGAPIDDFYYYRNFDPDNNVSISFDYTTTNTIVSQPGTGCNVAHVKATSVLPSTQPMSYVGLAGVGPQFRVTKGGFTNRDGSDIWDGTGGLVGTVGASTFADEAISLAYRIQNFGTGASHSFKFVVILDDAAATAAVDNLFYMTYPGSGASPAICDPSIDTATVCSGSSVSIGISGSALSDFTWSWTPATGLSSTTGPTTNASPTTSTMYVVTGTPLSSCYTAIVDSIFVEALPGPIATYVDPGPQCISYDLTTLTHSDANSIPGAHYGFYTTVPLTLADTSTGVFSGTIVVPGDVVYLVYWDPLLGCIHSIEVVIDWGGFEVDLNILQPTCANNDGEITAIPVDPGSYEFSIDGGITWQPMALFNGLAGGTYTISVRDSMGCIALADTILTPAPPPVAVAVAMGPTCNLACDGSATVTVTGNVGTLTYEVTTGGTTYPPQASNVLPLCDGSYTILVTDGYTGCTATVTGSVTPFPFTIVPTAGDSICIGQTATIGVTITGGGAPVNVVWDNGLSNATTHVIDPSGTTTYTVYAQDVSGCQTDSVTITIFEHPPLSVTASNDTTVCPAMAATINAIPSGGNGDYTITWTNNVNGTVLTGNTQTIMPASSPITYMATLTDGCGTPAAMDSVVISIYAVPNVTFVANNTSGCSPVNTTFINTTTASFVSESHWIFGDGGTADTHIAPYQFTEVGCHDVTLQVTTVDGCVVEKTIDEMICVFGYPEAEFTHLPAPADIFNPEVSFSNHSIDGVSYTWFFDDLGTTHAVHPTFTFPDDSAGVYPVCLVAANEHGCLDTTCHPVEIVLPFLIYVPNAFTPDGDGMNEVFLPVLNGEQSDTYEFFIFNRWGEIVFQTNNKFNGWDGTHKSIKAKEDVYVWKIIVKDARNSRKYEYKGHVNLLR